MENIAKILDAISAEGRAEADRILTAGQKNAEEVAKLYQEEASAEETAILKKAHKEVEEITQRGTSQAGIESRNIKLKAKRKALEKAFALALEELSGFSDEKKLELYSRLIGRYSSAKDVTILLNEADGQAFGAKLAKKAGKAFDMKVTFSKEKGDFLGGLILREGDIETNCTFEVLIQDTKKETETEIAAMLFA
ncbi:hypothetical protein LI177_07875 [bacterium 210820-DFI.6.37]|nr:hypothetical protein [bacterium 210820-DFI.6.37]